MTLTRQVLRLPSLTVVVSLALASAACVPEDRPTMNPGVDCVACHTVDAKSRLPSAPDDPGARAPSLAWTFGGTVYKDTQGTQALKGVHLMIKDSLGKQVDVYSNEAGNFYSSEPLSTATGLTVSIVDPSNPSKIALMGTHPTPLGLYGTGTGTQGVGCNGCHSQPNYQNKLTTVAVEALAACQGAPDRMGLPAGKACNARTDCCSTYCIDGQCSATPGEWGHSCTDQDYSGDNSTECAAHPSLTGSLDGYCRNAVCVGAPGRITIPSALTSFTLPDGTMGFGFDAPVAAP